MSCYPQFYGLFELHWLKLLVSLLTFCLMVHKQRYRSSTTCTTSAVVVSSNFEEEEFSDWKNFNGEGMDTTLNTLEELWVQASTRQEEIKRQIPEYYNSDVKKISYKIKELVLMKEDTIVRLASVDKLALCGKSLTSSKSKWDAKLANYKPILARKYCAHGAKMTWKYLTPKYIIFG